MAEASQAYDTVQSGFLSEEEARNSPRGETDEEGETGELRRRRPGATGGMYLCGRCGQPKKAQICVTLRAGIV